MSTIFAPTFWKRTTERAIKTAAQVAAALLVVDVTGIHDVNWPLVGSASALAAIVSVLTSVGSGYIGDDSPSLVG